MHLRTQVLQSAPLPPLSGPTEHWVPFNLAFIRPIITEYLMHQALLFPSKSSRNTVEESGA